MELTIFEAPSCDAEAKEMRSIADWEVFLASARKNDVYTLKDPDGGVHRFTFRPWADRDAKKTILGISFRRYNPARRGGVPAKGAFEL